MSGRGRPAAPDTILSSPRKTCGSVTGAASDADMNRRSPDLLPSLSQITGHSSQLSATSVTSREHLMSSVSHHNAEHDHENHQYHRHPPSSHISAPARHSGVYERFPQQALQHRESLGIGVPRQSLTRLVQSRDRIAGLEDQKTHYSKIPERDDDTVDHAHASNEVDAIIRHGHEHVPEELDEHHKEDHNKDIRPPEHHEKLVEEINVALPTHAEVDSVHIEKEQTHVTAHQTVVPEAPQEGELDIPFHREAEVPLLRIHESQHDLPHIVHEAPHKDPEATEVPQQHMPQVPSAPPTESDTGPVDKHPEHDASLRDGNQIHHHASPSHPVHHAEIAPVGTVDPEFRSLPHELHEKAPHDADLSPHDELHHQYLAPHEVREAQPVRLPSPHEKPDHRPPSPRERQPDDGGPSPHETLHDQDRHSSPHETHQAQHDRPLSAHEKQHDGQSFPHQTTHDRDPSPHGAHEAQYDRHQSPLAKQVDRPPSPHRRQHDGQLSPQLALHNRHSSPRETHETQHDRPLFPREKPVYRSPSPQKTQPPQDAPLLSAHTELRGKQQVEHDVHHLEQPKDHSEHPYHNSGANSPDRELALPRVSPLPKAQVEEIPKVHGQRTPTVEATSVARTDNDRALVEIKEHDHKIPDVDPTHREPVPPSAVGRSDGDLIHKEISEADFQSLSFESSKDSTVDRDYTFHKSRVWPGIVTMTLEKSLPAAKKMVLFNNENPKDAGYKFVLTEHAYRNWGQVLDEWTRKIKPKFGKITRVFTPIHGREVQDITQLKDNGVYIVGGGPHVRKNPRFPPARRVDSDAVRRLFHRDKIVKKNYEPPSDALVRRSETLPPLIGRKLFDATLPINVFRNGDIINPVVRVMLKGFDLYNMQKVMDCIGQKVRPTNGGVRSVVTVGGRPMHHVKDLLPNGYYVVLGLAERFIKDVPYRTNGIHEDYIMPKPMAYVARRTFKAPPQDVRQYPISNLLHMSDTSLVNCGFLPQTRTYSRKVKIAHSAVSDMHHEEPDKHLVI